MDKTRKEAYETVSSIANIVANSSMILQTMENKSELEYEQFLQLRETMFDHDAKIGQEFNNLMGSTRNADALSQLRPLPGTLYILGEIAEKTSDLRALRDSKAAWLESLIAQRRLLDSQDLPEYFKYVNDTVEFDRLNASTRASIFRGEEFMIDLAGMAVESVTEAKKILNDYPGSLIRNKVKTTLFNDSQYDGFDYYGRMLPVGEDSDARQRVITTLDQQDLRKHLQQQRGAQDGKDAKGDEANDNQEQKPKKARV